jgi:hypothetical protein
MRIAPAHNVESRATDGVGISSPEPVSPGAGGGARSRCVVRGLRSAGPGNSRPHGLTQNRLRRGVFHDLEELIMAIDTYIDRHNESPKPFIWTARAADILEKVKRARRSLNKRQSV